MLWRMPALVVTVVTVAAAVAVGCGETPAATSSSSVPAATEQPGTEGTSTVVSAESTTSKDVLSNRIAYAASLGGTSHQGETLFFIVGANVDTKEEAQALLEESLSVFGGMQSYFIVQWSSNFDGMEPGRWVVMEAYRSNPSAEMVDVALGAFPKPSVVRATVKTAEPLPVHED